MVYIFLFELTVQIGFYFCYLFNFDELIVFLFVLSGVVLGELLFI